MMMNFVSNTRNPYEMQKKTEEKPVPGQFISKSKAGTIHMFKNKTASLKGRKVTFKNI